MSSSVTACPGVPHSGHAQAARPAAACSPWQQLAGPALSTGCTCKLAAAAGLMPPLAGPVRFVNLCTCFIHAQVFAAPADQKLPRGRRTATCARRFQTTPSAHPSVWTGWSASLPCPNPLREAETRQAPARQGPLLEPPAERALARARSTDVTPWSRKTAIPVCLL